MKEGGGGYSGKEFKAKGRKIKDMNEIWKGKRIKERKKNEAIKKRRNSKQEKHLTNNNRQYYKTI